MNPGSQHDADSAPSPAEELLAASASWDFSPSRPLRSKEVLLRHIDRDRLNGAGRSTRKSLDRRLSPVIVVPVVAALIGVLAVTASHDGHAPGRIAAPPAQYNGASATLDRIATAAMSRDVTPVKDSQLVYVETLLRENLGALGGPVRLSALHKDERWTVQSRGPMTREGWEVQTGKDAIMPGELLPFVAASPVYAGPDHPTYEWLASLPTDPETLRAELYAQAGSWGDWSDDETVFRNIGSLLGSTIMPPATASALYKVSEKIPGVHVVPDAVDAVGRHGIGITRKDPGATTRDEWIFSRSSLAYLGSRHYIVGPGRTSETLYGVDAVMRRGVVDHRGETPPVVES